MGLQIWLPLNGSIKNQGLSNATLTTTGGSWSTISKIGTKSFTNGTITMDAATTGSIYNNNEMTFAFWFYANAADGTSTGNCIIGNSHMYGTNNRKFAIFNYQTINDLHWSWQVDGIEGGANGEVTVGGTLNDIFPSYKWTHVCITYKNPIAKIYINGELKATSTGDISSGGFNYATPILNLNSLQCVNDLRIYDNCLSVKEVKQLAQGLVVYYPLTGNYGGASNLFLNSHTQVSNNEYNTVQYTPSETLVAGEKYTLTICVTPGEGVTHVAPYLSSGYSGLGDMITDGTAKRQILTKTFTARYYSGKTPTDSPSHGKIYMYRFPKTGISSNTTYHWAKLEKGTEFTGYWRPNDSENNFNNIEFDCSGYGFDATRNGLFTYAGDSARNTCSAVFNNSTTYITTPLKDLMTNLLANECTINFWVNEASTSSRSVYLGGYNGSNGFNIEEINGKFRVYWNGSPDIQISSVEAGEWTMWTVVVNKASGIKIYKNGHLEKNHSAALNTVATNGTFYIGRDSRTADKDVWFEGSMSDFKIFATELSQEDIIDLYDVSVSIDEDGRLHSSEFRGL